MTRVYCADKPDHPGPPPNKLEQPEGRSYRFHLAANPNLPPSGDAALFASLPEVVGRPINEYAFGDLAQLVATLDKVMAWDERTANDFTSRTAHADAWKRIRAGLGELRTHITRNGDQLRAQRKQNGLENRTP